MRRLHRSGLRTGQGCGGHAGRDGPVGKASSPRECSGATPPLGVSMSFLSVHDSGRPRSPTLLSRGCLCGHNSLEGFALNTSPPKAIHVGGSADTRVPRCPPGSSVEVHASRVALFSPPGSPPPLIRKPFLGTFSSRSLGCTTCQRETSWALHSRVEPARCMAEPVGLARMGTLGPRGKEPAVDPRGLCVPGPAPTGQAHGCSSVPPSPANARLKVTVSRPSNQQAESPEPRGALLSACVSAGLQLPRPVLVLPRSHPDPELGAGGASWGGGQHLTPAPRKGSPKQQQGAPLDPEGTAGGCAPSGAPGAARSPSLRTEKRQRGRARSDSPGASPWPKLDLSTCL